MVAYGSFRDSLHRHGCAKRCCAFGRDPRASVHPKNYSEEEGAGEWRDSWQLAAVPEPSTLILTVSMLAGIFMLKKKN
jgi:hypothetical protein